MAKGRKTSKPKQDLGDSSGYGQGGSALDYHEVLGEERLPDDLGPNPLDQVVRTDRSNENNPPSGERGAKPNRRG